MYISVLAIGILAIAGVTVTFNRINLSTVESTVEAGLQEVAATVATELKNVLELGLNTDPQTKVMINRTLTLPRDLSGHQYTIQFTILPNYNHYIIVATDITDSLVDEVSFETTIPWTDVSLTNQEGTGIPILRSNNLQHHLNFLRTEGSTLYKILIW
jgi:hypothetical protein